MRGRLLFLTRALLWHFALVMGLVALQWSGSAHQTNSEAFRWALIFIVAVCVIGFYFKVDYFFLSYRLSEELKTRRLSGRELSAGEFLFVKLFVWVYVLGFPVLTLLLSLLVSIPLITKVYLGLVYVLSIGLLAGYLFRSYREYQALHGVNKWGVLATW